jgi:hypothetical protein
MKKMAGHLLHALPVIYFIATELIAKLSKIPSPLAGEG